MRPLPNFHFQVVPNRRHSLAVLIITAGCLVEMLNAKEAAAATYLRPAAERSGRYIAWHSRRNRQSAHMLRDMLCVHWSSTQLNVPLAQLSLQHTDRNLSALATISDATPHYHQSSATLVNTSTFTTPNTASEQEISCQRHINSSKQSAVLLLTNHSECEGARISCGELLASQHSGIVEVLTATPVFATNTTSNASANRFTSLLCSSGFALTSITAFHNGSFRYECTSLNHSNSNPAICVLNRIQILDVVLQFSFYAAALAVIVTVFIIVISIVFLDRGRLQYKQRQFKLTIRLGVFISLLLLFFCEAGTASQLPSSTACYIATAVGLYATAAFCMWCLLEGYALHQHVANVLARPPHHFVAKCIIVAQGLPLIVVSLYILISRVGFDYIGIGRGSCRVMDSGLAKYVVLLPITLILFLFNFVVFLEVVWVLAKLPRKGSEKRRTIAKRAKGSLAVFFILGLGWLPTYISSFWDCLGLGGVYICPIAALLTQAAIVLTYHISSELPSLKKFCRAVRIRLHTPRSPSRSSFGNYSGSKAPASPSTSDPSSNVACPGGKSPRLSATSTDVHGTPIHKSVTGYSIGSNLYWEISL